jgi:hypothetical protein
MKIIKIINLAGQIKILGVEVEDLKTRFKRRI